MAAQTPRAGPPDGFAEFAQLARLLTEQEEQIRTLAERESDPQAEAPFYDAVKPQQPTTPPDEKRLAFMSQLFQANLELRESVNKTGS